MKDCLYLLLFIEYFCIVTRIISFYKYKKDIYKIFGNSSALQDVPKQEKRKIPTQLEIPALTVIGIQRKTSGNKKAPFTEINQ